MPDRSGSRQASARALRPDTCPSSQPAHHRAQPDARMLKRSWRVPQRRARSPLRRAAPVARKSFNRRSFLKTIGAAALGAPFIKRGLMAQSPNGMVRHASFGAAGMAWSDVTEFSKFPQFKLVAVAEVDLNRTAELKKKFPDVKIYQDWRKLLDKEAKNIDSVNVSTPDHMHAS